MLPIPFAKLQAHYLGIKEEIDAAIASCLTSGVFINGPEVVNFCKSLAEYLSVKHVIPCANGTDALQIALMAFDVKPGDEVIVPAFGYVSPAEAIALLGGKPVFVDVHEDTYLVDETKLEPLITEKTKGIIPIHLFGQNANTQEILKIADKYNLFVVEDAAQSLGSAFTFKDGQTAFSGTMGSIGCTSFFPTKNLGCCGDGGAMFTNDDLLAEKLRSIAWHGQRSKYSYDCIGVNSRLDALQAAILSVTLPYLDRYNERRREIATFYNQQFNAIAQIKTPAQAVGSDHIFHQYILQVASADLRNGLKMHLSDKQIESHVYYPRPLHLQRAYAFLGYLKGDFPVAESLCDTSLALPVYPELTDSEIQYIASTVNTFFKL